MATVEKNHARSNLNNYVLFSNMRSRMWLIRLSCFYDIFTLVTFGGRSVCQKILVYIFISLSVLSFPLKIVSFPQRLKSVPQVA